MKYKSLLSTSADFKGVFKVRSPTGDNYTYNSKKESTPAGHEDRFGYNMGNHFTIQIPEDASTGWYDAKLELRNFYTDELCDETEWLKDQFKIEPSGSTGGDIRLTNDPADSENPRIAVDSKNNVHIIWVDNREGNYGIYYTKLDNNGKTLIDDKELITLWLAGYELCFYDAPAIAIDSNDNIHIAWVDSNDYVSGYLPREIYYAKLDNKGNKIIDYKTIDNDPALKRSPDIGVDSDNNIHIVWEDYREGNSKTYYAKLNNNGNRLIKVEFGMKVGHSDRPLCY